MKILRKNGKNGTKEMEIVNYDGKLLPTPQKTLPKKIVGFEHISIGYIDQNAITFLQHFRQLFAASINLAINTSYGRISESTLHDIWPIIAKHICAIKLDEYPFSGLEQFVPLILNDCPSLLFIDAYFDGFFAEFPGDDSDNALYGQALAKWLFTPRPDNVPKVFKCLLQPWWYEQLVSSIEYVKAAFANASSPANFIVVMSTSSFHDDFVVPFDQTNELTREQLTLKRMNDVGRFLLLRSPIVRDTDKWAKWENEAIDWHFYGKWNKIDIN